MMGYDYVYHEELANAAEDLRRARRAAEAARVKWLNEIMGEFSKEMVSYVLQRAESTDDRAMVVNECEKAVQWKLESLVNAIRYGDEKV